MLFPSFFKKIDNGRLLFKDTGFFLITLFVFSCSLLFLSGCFEESVPDIKKAELVEIRGRYLGIELEFKNGAPRYSKADNVTLILQITPMAGDIFEYKKDQITFLELNNIITLVSAPSTKPVDYLKFKVILKKENKIVAENFFVINKKGVSLKTDKQGYQDF